LKGERALVVDFLKNRLPHEIRNDRTLLGIQMQVEDVSIGQDGVEMLYDSAISINSTQVFTPCLQAKGQQVNKQRALDAHVAKVVYVFPQVISIRLFAWAQSCKPPQMPIASLKSLLCNLLWGRVALSVRCSLIRSLT
jgi:hypothetical protein